MRFWIKPAKWAELTRGQRALNLGWIAYSLVMGVVSTRAIRKVIEENNQLQEENIRLSIRNGELRQRKASNYGLW